MIKYVYNLHLTQNDETEKIYKNNLSAGKNTIY